MRLRTLHAPLGALEPVKQKLHYIFAIDVSGSMSYDLPKLRQDLKNKLATQIKPGQSVSIIYYSSNGVCGIVVKEFQIESLASLQNINEAIDRWLTPISMTGFVQPIQLANSLAIEVLKGGAESIFVFMSDGYENQNHENLVLLECAVLASNVVATYIVEYGDYANHNLLQKMAERMNGQLMVAGELQDYNLVIDTVLGTKSLMELEITPKPDDLFVYSILDNGFVSAWPILHFQKGNKIKILVDPERVVMMFSGDSGQDYMPEVLLPATLAAFNIGAIHTVNQLLAYIGDQYLLDKYSGAIGKQRRNEFADLLRQYNVDTNLLFRHKPRLVGYEANPMEPDLFDLMEVLSAEPGNKLLVRHPLFKYKRGGLKLEDTKDGLNKLEFTEKGGQCIDFDQLVFNTTRANFSVRGKFQGIVNVGNHPDNPNPENISYISTHIYRTYNLVRDGIVVMDEIPVYLRPDTLQALGYLDIYPRQVEEQVWLINLADLPVANANRVVNAAIGKKFAEVSYEYMVYQAYQKVFRYYYNQMELKKPSTEWLDRFGETGVKFLKSVGIDESNGFHPTNTKGEPNDVYYAPTVDLKISGYNSLPSVTDILKRKEAGKTLQNAALLMSHAIDEYSKLMLKPEPHLLLTEAVKQIVIAKREREVELAGIVFAALLSRQEFQGFEGGKLTLDCSLDNLLPVYNIHTVRVFAPKDEIEFTLVEIEDEVPV